ncbi:MAG: hypothetical protein OQL20_08005 [Sedimenticola sp.]|nr:hypothetical protein [Sedimenticola sp.]
MDIQNYCKKIVISALCFAVLVGDVWGDVLGLRPYVLSSNVQADRVKTLIEVKQALEKAGFELVGEYAPDEARHVVVVTSAYLKQLAKKDIGALFAVPLRISFTHVQGKLQVAYTNPQFIQHAYHVKGDLSVVSEQLRSVLGVQALFGSVGLSESQLLRYKYSYGMESFHDYLEIKRFRTHNLALQRIRQVLDKPSAVLGKVFEITIPGTATTLFGVSIKQGKGGDRTLSDAVDTGLLKHTPRLPYTVVVKKGRVFTLHPRFKLPLDFPDLKRTGDYSFTRIIQAPGAIETALRTIVEAP